MTPSLLKLTFLLPFLSNSPVPSHSFYSSTKLIHYSLYTHWNGTTNWSLWNVPGGQTSKSIILSPQTATNCQNLPKGDGLYMFLQQTVLVFGCLGSLRVFSTNSSYYCFMNARAMPCLNLLTLRLFESYYA